MLGLFCADRARRRRGFVGTLLLTVAASLGWAGGDAVASDVVVVEERWVLQVTSSDSNSTAPQVATAFSPSGDVSDLHAMFEMNHQSVPDFVPGGLHLQLWQGEELTQTRKFPNPNVMSGGGETVTWTQRMELEGSTLTFSIVEGSSTTWSAFGGQGYLKSSAATTLPNLNGYRPEVSVEHSGVTYAGNRVGKLMLQSVRRIAADGQQTVDETERVIHEH